MVDFKCIFNNELNSFIKYKRSCGLKYQNEIPRLKRIDKILLELKTKKIDKEFFEKLTKRNNMNEANYARQYGVTVDFCKFLINQGYKNIYYEEKNFKIINNYIPVIYSDEEIELLFNTLDNEIGNSKLKHSYSLMFKLLYGCGLRISEVCRIKRCDINLSDSTINIIDSKRGKSRLVVFSKTLKTCLHNYINKYNIVSDDYLFLNTWGNTIGHESIRLYYKKNQEISGLDTVSHIHDLRHVFCNKALNQMLERGYDENVVIVYLYKYMGHCSIRETEYYLHFTDIKKDKIINNNDSFSKKLYERIDFLEE